MLLPVHKNTKLLIFDCDGTLANNMHIHINAWQNVLNQKNTRLSISDLAQYNGLPSEYILKDMFKYDEREIPLIADEIKRTTFKLLNQSKPIKPVVDLVKYYYKKKLMLVISGGERKNVYKTLDTLGLKSYFEEIITADDSHPSKANVEAFSLLAEKYSCRPEQCHVFEDGTLGLINALKAGMNVTDVRNITLS